MKCIYCSNNSDFNSIVKKLKQVQPEEKNQKVAPLSEILTIRRFNNNFNSRVFGLPNKCACKEDINTHN